MSKEIKVEDLTNFLDNLEELSKDLLAIDQRYPEDSDVKKIYGNFEVIRKMITVIDKANDIEKLSSFEKGNYFIQHFNQKYEDPLFQSNVKKWAKTILADEYKYDRNGSMIRSWDKSFASDILNAIVETQNAIHATTEEENEMLSILKHVDETASANNPISVVRDDLFKSTCWLYEHDYIDGVNHRADDDNYYMFFVNGLSEKGKRALKDGFIY